MSPMRLLVRSSALLLLLLCGTGAGFFSDPARLATLNTARWDTSDVGVVWSDDFNRPTLGTNWALFGGTAITHTNNEILVSPGDGYLLYQPWLISSDAWTLRWTQRFAVLNATSYGVGVGLRNLQIYGGTNRAYNALLSGTGGWFGQYSIEQLSIDGLHQGRVTNGPAMALAVGDVVECSLTRAGWDMFATASNRANGQVSSCAFTYSIPALHPQPTISGICIYAEGGTVFVDDLSFAINRRKPARFVVIGDSISDGFGVSAYAAEYRSVLQSNYTEVVCNESSSYNTTSNALGVLPEILSQQPQTAILMIGGNDVYLKVPEVQWKLQYSNLVAQLQANGVGVVHCLPTPRNNVNLSQLKTWISTNYAGAKIVDLWTPLLTGSSALKPAYDSGDGVHPNDAGHFLMGSIIHTNLP
jgi:lysophospholipase L1-like esterase